MHSKADTRCSVSRAVEDSPASYESRREQAHAVLRDAGMDGDLTETINELETEMLAAANNLEFEKAALLRDQIRELKRLLGEAHPLAPGGRPAAARYPQPSGRRGRAARRGPARAATGRRTLRDEPF